MTTIDRAGAAAWLRAQTAWRLVSAEFLKVRKRRGLVALAVILTAGAIVAAGAVLALLVGSGPRPGLGVMAQGGAWALLAATVIYLVALGLASLTGSRSATGASVWRTVRATARQSCRAARSSGSRSPGPWWPGRRSSSATSRPVRSTATPPRMSWGCCARRWTPAARP